MFAMPLHNSRLRLNGKRMEKGVAEAWTVINMCKKLGAENIFNVNLNCGSTCDIHNGWVHCDWPRSAAPAVTVVVASGVTRATFDAQRSALTAYIAALVGVPASRLEVL